MSHMAGSGEEAPLDGTSLHEDAMLEHEQATGKRLDRDDDYEENDASRKRKKTNNPQKKLNNEQWDLMFDRLVEYKNQHGDCLVPKRYAADPKLGTWVETQRVQWKKLPRSQEDNDAVTPNKRLNAERLQRLESIGFAWSAKNVRKPKPAAEPKKRTTPDAASRALARQRLNDAQWQEMYNRLVEYKAKYGDCLVPKKFEEDPKLATWVETQRNSYNRDFKKGKSEEGKSEGGEEAAAAAMPSPQAAEGKTPEEWAAEMEQTRAGMESADPLHVATTMDAHEVAAAAMEVVNEVMNTTDDGSASAAEGKSASKRLTPERKQKLDELGFVWSLRSKRVDEHWDDMFRQLVQYKEKHGDCLVPSRYEENFKLGKWVETQRYEYTKLQRAADQQGSPKEEESDKKLPSSARLTEERRRRLEAIGFEWKVKHKMKRYYDRQWDVMFEKLKQFKEQTGHCLVPKRYPPDMKLGTWVHTQRIQYRKVLAGVKKEGGEEEAADDTSKGEEEQQFRLTEDRRRRLEELGFVWSARESEKATEPAKLTRNSYDDQWDSMFERLKAYKERHGNCLVPKRCKDDPKLGTWVDTQRVQRKKLLKHLAKQGDEEADDKDPQKPVVGRLTDDRISRLENLGFVWSLRDDWQKHYEELKEYKKEHGHCNVPARYPANRRLGIWVSAQRQQKKMIDNADGVKPGRSAPLTPDRIKLLDDLGFTWTIRSRDSLGESWNQRLVELKAYKNVHGDCLVPSRYPPNPELGIWVGTQRTQYRLYMKAKEAGKALSLNSAMNEDRIAQLEELGFVWALRGTSDSVWRKRIGELEEFRLLHGHTDVPSIYKANQRMGSWVASQRLQYRLMQEGKPSSLDEEKVAELDSMHFNWDVPPGTNDEIAPDDAMEVAGALDGDALEPVPLSEQGGREAAENLSEAIMGIEHAEI